MDIEHKRIRAIVEKAGAEFIGIKAISKKYPLLVWFNDPKTHTTKTIRLDRLTGKAVKAKLK